MQNSMNNLMNISTSVGYLASKQPLHHTKHVNQVNTLDLSFVSLLVDTRVIHTISSLYYHIVDWWDQFGDEVPELRAFAIRVLGLTCSSSACECNWSTFNQVHTKRRNRLTTSRMNTLVDIMYKKKLNYKFLKAQSCKEEDDSLIVENVSSDDEWVANPNDEDDEETRMIDLDEAIDVEDAGGSSQRPRKRRRSKASRKGYCQNLIILSII
ncbi:LOW QUALITY PROTEIN: HAT, C-terminal dimerization domain containing protein [Trema orientale]|uniref:HAT, C-terminal dimerization domain containing protein n=1 Tax=Trema orientale TaxID=63057 RepID=A0A2P5FA55_TREOI|nr:LOW QUALITY PROTEIN: HAT, C-terminal dimerization domain containing protein [Trema orientale]